MATVAVTVTCSDDPPVAVDDTKTVAEDTPDHRPVDVLANDTDADGGEDRPVGHPARQRHGRDHRRRQRPDLHPDREPTAAPAAGSTYTFTDGPAPTPRPCRSRSPASTTRRWRSTTRRRWARTRARPWSTCSPTTPTWTAARRASSRSPSRPTAAVVITGGDRRQLHAERELLQHPAGGPDTFTYTVNGGSTATVAMTVTCAADAPVVDSTRGRRPDRSRRTRRTTRRGPGAPSLTPNATVRRRRDDHRSRRCEITANYAGAQDVLEAMSGTHPAGITASQTGDTLARSAATRRRRPTSRPCATSRYRNSSDSPSTLTRTLTFTATDNDGDSNRARDTVKNVVPLTAADDTVPGGRSTTRGHAAG